MGLKKIKLPLWVWDAIWFVIIIVIPTLLLRWYDDVNPPPKGAWVTVSALVALIAVIPIYLIYSIISCIISCRSKEKLFHPLIFKCVFMPLISVVWLKTDALMPESFAVFIAIFVGIYIAAKYLSKDAGIDKKMFFWALVTVPAGIILSLIGFAAVMVCYYYHYSSNMFETAISIYAGVLGFVYGVVTYVYLKRMDAWFLSFLAPSPYVPITSGCALIGMLVAKMIFGIINKGSQGIETKQ